MKARLDVIQVEEEGIGGKVWLDRSDAFHFPPILRAGRGRWQPPHDFFLFAEAYVSTS